MESRDNRRADRFNRSKQHFKKHAPRTKRDMSKLSKPAENTNRYYSRQEYKVIAEETMAVLTDGFYEYDEEKVDISQSIQDCIKNTVSYKPEDTPLEKEFEKKDTVYEIKKETTLQGCHREYEANSKANICALNFASAKNPGGGFLNGSHAQEESLARASALYLSIKDSEMYLYNTKDDNQSMYSDYMIYSPTVPVFRNDQCEFLEGPYSISFITAPCVNTKEALKKGVQQEQIDDVIYERMDKLLSVAMYHNTDILVLGAWGCGVFGGDIERVALLFKDLLKDKYGGAFEKVIFSVLSQHDFNVLDGVFNDY
jgi:uncharacterized protein (TIGR02452 family)